MLELDALRYGFSHISKSDNFATVVFIWSWPRTEQSTAWNYL